MKAYYNGQRSRRQKGTESGTQGDKMLFKDLTEEQKDLLATADKGVRKRVAGQVRQDLVDEGTFDPETFSFRK